MGQGMDEREQTGGEGLNWAKGCWSANKAGEEMAEVILAGDWAPIRSFASIVEQAPEAVYGDLLPVLRSADLRIANLECTLFGERPVWKSGAVFKGHAGHVRGLTAIPFEVVTLANNHVFDYGSGAFRQTRELLQGQGIRFLGAGMSASEAEAPLIVECRGIAVGIVNFSEGEDLTAAGPGPGVFGWDVARAAALVGAVRDQVDVVIAICHCGVEYIAFPPPYVTEAFERLADAGADLVVGHHPHVPQGIHIHNGVPICYSLGNFVFYQETDLWYRKVGYLVKAGIGKAGLSRLEIIPYGISGDGLRLLRNGEYARFMASLQAVSEPLAHEATVRDAWHGFLRYYGREGFRKEIGMILRQMEAEPPKGAAMLRNRVATMQHREHWIDAMTRIMDVTIAESPAWAYDLTMEWLTRKRCAG
jgi:poly-gamma-glutamate synthesis protein (capsule biosynthesis protein)